jgi:hypothetical protein
MEPVQTLRVRSSEYIMVESGSGRISVCRFSDRGRRTGLLCEAIGGIRFQFLSWEDR